jgi:UDP:flavonoid glycosyltransferase YjiC (YdhE family)
VVLACWGSYGDLFPYLAIATELRARGHVPVIASCPYYETLVTQEGFAFAPLRPDVRPDDTALLRQVMDPQRGSELIIRELVVAALRDTFDDLSAAGHGADLLVSHPITFAAPLVAERARLPWMASVLAPLSFFSPYDFPALPNAPRAVALRRLGPWTGRALMALARRITRPWVAPVVALRAELGLPPAGDPLYEGQFSPFGNLALFSRCLGDVQRDWPARTQVTGFPFFNRAIPMPPDVAAFLDAGEPPVVFTLGSAAVSAAGTFYEESAKSVAALGCRAILLVGRHPENIPGHLPAHVLAVDSAPHDQLFPRAAVVVHQGGVGTTGQAMRSGRPQLVVPHAHDQPDNAFRVKRLGIARVVYPTRYRASRVVAELKTLLSDHRTRANAAEVGCLVRAEAGASAAVAALLDVLATRRGADANRGSGHAVTV